MSDLDDLLVGFSDVEAPALPGERWGRTHVLVVHSAFDGDDEEDFEILHDESCGSISRYRGPDGEEVFEPNCGLWWQLSEGGPLLEQLEIKKINAGRYNICHWTRTYTATPDHGTEYDGGIMFDERSLNDE